MPFLLDLPDIDDPYGLADWLEVMILRREKSKLSRAHLIESLAANLGATPQELEVPVNFLYKEIKRRRHVAGEAYPLFVDGTFIVSAANAKSMFYLFLLLLSIDGPMRRNRRYCEIDVLFDEVVCEALLVYFGSGTRTLRFGWPPSGGRPSTFAKALLWLSDETGLALGVGKHAPDTKDGGLDVVAWRPFKDGRTAFGVTLIQCTVQSNWFPKGKDILEHVWLGRIDTGRPVYSSLAVPFVIPKNYPKWDDLRRTVNIVFDRLRLVELLSVCDETKLPKMVEWSRKELARISA
jgi:hypothetical protein